MTFVSYAQNYEDVILWRALKHIEKGFYVDVGANDPLLYSVTQAFYERGWSGINIEPMQSYYEQLISYRPKDINLPVAVADIAGELTFYEILETGISTLVEDVAEKQRNAGWKVTQKPVPVTTLNQVLEKNATGPIHFLKVDVEGAEKAVLDGLDLQRWRPWIMVIEATVPSSSELNFNSWEPYILDAGYGMAYFDGLNRFYVAEEHNELKDILNVPPNVFDNFTVVTHKNTIEERDRALTELKRAIEDHETVRAELHKVCIDRDAIQAQLNQVTTDRARIEAELQHVYQSRSYRITAPMRATFGLARIVRFRAKVKVKEVLTFVVKYLASHPYLKDNLKPFLNYFPGYKLRLKNLITSHEEVSSQIAMTPKPAISLSLKERQIYNDLVNAIVQRKAQG